MENQTAFDLNHAIQSWREDLAQSPAFRSENLNELESHLRDSVAALRARGLSAEEAYLIGVKRIGGGRALEAEFGKLNAGSVWVDRMLWILVGIQIWMAMSVFCSAVAFYTNKVATHLSMERGYYSDAQRAWIITHGAGAPATILELLGLLAAPVTLGLVAIIMWKSLLKSKRKKGELMDVWLSKPVRLGGLLFVMCFGFQFIAGSLQEIGKHQFYWWQILLMQIVYAFPQYLIGSALIVVLARKRLRAVLAA